MVETDEGRRQKISERPDQVGPLGQEEAFDFVLSVTRNHERVLSREAA